MQNAGQKRAGVTAGFTAGVTVGVTAGVPIIPASLTDQELTSLLHVWSVCLMTQHSAAGNPSRLLCVGLKHKDSQYPSSCHMRYACIRVLQILLG